MKKPLDKLIAHLYNGAATSKILFVGFLQAKQSPVGSEPYGALKLACLLSVFCALFNDLREEPPLLTALTLNCSRLGLMVSGLVAFQIR